MDNSHVRRPILRSHVPHPRLDHKIPGARLRIPDLCSRRSLLFFSQDLRLVFLGVDSPIFSTIVLLKNQLFLQGFGWFLERRMPGKNANGSCRVLGSFSWAKSPTAEAAAVSGAQIPVVPAMAFRAASRAFRASVRRASQRPALAAAAAAGAPLRCCLQKW